MEGKIWIRVEFIRRLISGLPFLYSKNEFNLVQNEFSDMRCKLCTFADIMRKPKQKFFANNFISMHVSNIFELGFEWFVAANSG